MGARILTVVSVFAKGGACVFVDNGPGEINIPSLITHANASHT